MTPHQRETITAEAAALAARSVSAQIGTTAEQAARLATASLWRTQLAKFRRAAIFSAVALAALLGAFFIGAKQTAKSRTERPEARATAKCEDGTLSYATSHQGACASHGGVKTFYK